MSLLNVTGLSKSFGGLVAVDKVSFSVEEGTIKSVIGPNGAGKTTLFNLISGFLPPDSGEIMFQKRPLQGEKPHQVAAKGIARTFQQIRLFPNMTVLENVMMGRHMHTRAGFLAGMFRIPWTRREELAAEEKCLKLMTELEITNLAGFEATSLAYGQQRVVELARAASCEPKLLLLDEPAAGLNEQETDHLSELIGHLRDRGITILLVEHDMDLVMGISESVTVLDSGKVIAEGPPAEVRKNPEVLRAYLGEEDF